MRESSLERILGVLRARWWMVPLLATPILVLSFWYAASRPPEYRSQVLVTLTPAALGTPDGSFLRLVPRYLFAATEVHALRTAEAAAGLPAGALDDSVTAANPTGSLQIELTATTSDADRSRAAVASLAESLLAAAEDDPLLDVRILEGPTDPSDITPTRQVVSVGVGIVVALVLGVGLAFLLEGMRPRVRTRDDIEAVGLPVILTLPRRRLQSLAAAPADARHADGLEGLRWELAAGYRTVVATSVDSSGALDVTRLTEVLVRPAQPGRVPVGGRDGGPAAPIVIAQPGLLSEAAAQAAVVEHRACLVVVTAGVPLERAQDCVRLLTRLDADPIGGILIR